MTQPTPSRGRRSRIVIDVARVQEEARRKKRRSLLGRAGRYVSVTALVIIAVVLVVLVGCYVWWRSFEKSPACTGNGGLLRGSPRLPSMELKSAVSSPQM